MKLATLSSAMNRLTDGETDEAAKALYGDVSSLSARRLAVYARSLRHQRFESVDHVFAHTRMAVRGYLGEAGWSDLVEAYFRAHPARHFEINSNGAELPLFLSAASALLPPWIAELADLEWWAWQMECANDGDDGGQGPLRLASTVEMRAYEHNLLAWLDTERRPPAPEAAKTIVLFWRDRDQDSRHISATLAVASVLKWLHDGRRIEDPTGKETASGAGISILDWERTVEILRDCGVLVGER